jgi:NAD(P)H-hydrate repair Nnr-like enzyme with NAD(P)H-hydrate dehydratase domain
MSPLDAARYGVYLHGCSGDRLQKQVGVGFSASELADELSPLLADVRDGRR